MHDYNDERRALFISLPSPTSALGDKGRLCLWGPCRPGASAAATAAADAAVGAPVSALENRQPLINRHNYSLILFCAFKHQ